MDAPEQEGFTLGRASRRKRDRRLGLIPQPSHPLRQTHETPPLLGPLPGWEKISACLIELILPYLPEEAGIREWRAGIGMAAMAWNLALLPAPERALEIEQMGRDAEADAMDPIPLEDLLLLLITRKLRLFPDDPRLVLSWEVKNAGSRVHVLAMASLPVSSQDLAAGYRAEAESPSLDAEWPGVESEGL
jgi:hypothetical protein